MKTRYYAGRYAAKGRGGAEIRGADYVGVEVTDDEGRSGSIELQADCGDGRINVRSGCYGHLMVRPIAANVVEVLTDSWWKGSRIDGEETPEADLRDARVALNQLAVVASRIGVTGRSTRTAADRKELAADIRNIAERIGRIL